MTQLILLIKKLLEKIIITIIKNMDKLLEKIIITIILLMLKIYIDLDFISHSVDNLIIAISALSWDFNPFTSEITKFFNGNSGEEGEGSNRQNNPQGSNIYPPSTSTSSEEGGIVLSEEELEQVKALYENNSEFFGQIDTELDAILKGDDEQKRLIEEGVRKLEERKAEMKQRIRDFFDLKNQGESEESLSDIKRELVEDGKALYEDFKNLKDKAHTHKAEVDKLCWEVYSKAAQKMRDSIDKDHPK